MDELAPLNERCDLPVIDVKMEDLDRRIVALVDEGIRDCKTVRMMGVEKRERSQRWNERAVLETRCLKGVSMLNFALLSFPNIPSCITISHDPSRLSRDACPTLHPPLCVIPHDSHDPNNSYNLCPKTNQSHGVYRDILECYPGHPDPSRPRGLLPHPASLFPAACGIATTPRLQQLELPLTTTHSCCCSPLGTRLLNVS